MTFTRNPRPPLACGPLLALAALLASLPPLGSAEAAAAAETSAAVLANLEKRVAALAAADRELPRDTFDPHAIIEQVGRDPDKLFAWVRDHTFWVPYRGSLRGPRGVLMDRLGNSLDRSLLLAELLRAAGHDVQLARATLAEPEARRLIAGVRAPPPQRIAIRSNDATRRDRLLEGYAKRFGLDLTAMRRAVERMDREEAALAAEAKARLDTQLPLVLAALSDTAPGPAAKAQDDPLRFAALRDHWWIQRKRGGDAWDDLDVLMPDAAPGKTLAAPQGTVRIAYTDGVPVLPEGDAHDLVVRVIAERCAGGKLSEAVALQHVLRPAAALGRRVVVQTPPLASAPLPNPLTSKNFAADYRAAALAHKEWLPILVIGRQQVTQKSVRDDGSVNSAPSLNPAGLVADATRNTFGGLGGALGGGGAGGGEDQAAQSALTAVWIEYELRSPGDKPRLVRQAIFDLIGPAARRSATVAQPAIDQIRRLDRSLALLGHVNILALGCDLSAPFVEHQMAAALGYNLGKTTALARRVGDGDPRTRPDFLATARALEHLPGPLESFALFRRAWSPRREHTYLDRINVAALIERPAVGADGRLLERRVFDVIANDVAVLPGAAGADPFRARVEQGIVDTICEDLVLSGTDGPSAGAPAVAAADAQAAVAEPPSAAASVHALANASRLFASAGKGLQLALVRSPDDGTYKHMALPPDVRAGIDAALAAGDAVVLPHQPVQPPRATADPRWAWYSVNRATGTCIGVSDNGYRTAQTEYEALNARVAQVFGNPHIRMQHVAEASQDTVYRWFASRFGHSPDLLRACINLREACINAVALL